MFCDLIRKTIKIRIHNNILSSEPRTTFYEFLVNSEQILGHKKGEKMFKLHSKFEPTGDQPEAIKQLVNGIEKGEKYQTLLGVTGSRKNFYNGKCHC